MLFIFILPTGRWEVYETEFTHMGKNSRNPELVSKNITIHNECPCRIEISHPSVGSLTWDEACRVPG